MQLKTYQMPLLDRQAIDHNQEYLRLRKEI